MVKQANGADSDDEEEDVEEGETHFGNILIRRCPRSPYFLDPYGAAPKVNAEETGPRGILFPQAPPRKRRFLGADISRLRQMVRQQNQQLLYSQLYTRTMEDSGTLTSAQLMAFEAEKQRISRMSDAELEMDSSRIDWDTIQATGFTSRTVKELEAEWKLFCDPNFERGPWTVAEDEALLASVQRRKERYWDLVAADMNHRRLPVQYLSRYQQVLKPRNAPDARETTSRSYSVKTSLKGKPTATRGNAYSVAGAKDAERPPRAPGDDAEVPIELNDADVIMTAKSGVKWTPEEDDMLVEAVKKFGDKNWASVATLLGGLRTGQQCLHRWQKTLNPDIRRGRWDTKEDNLLAMAVRAYGAGNWRLIHKHVPGRTDVQCRERWVNVLDPAVKSTEGWTVAEDAHLMAVVASQPAGKWSAVAKLHNEGMMATFYRKHPHLNPQDGNSSVDIVDANAPNNPGALGSQSNNGSNGSQGTASSALETGLPLSETQGATMDLDDEIAPVQAPTPSHVRATQPHNDKAKPPSSRTDNQCWRRWKLLSKAPERPVGTPRAPGTPRTPSTTPKAKKSAKKTKARKHLDWMRDDSEEEDEDDYRRPTRSSASVTTSQSETAGASGTTGRISSRLAAKQTRDAELASELSRAMDVDESNDNQSSTPTPRQKATAKAAKGKEKVTGQVQLERAPAADPNDPNARPRLKLLIRRKVVENPPE